MMILFLGPFPGCFGKSRLMSFEMRLSGPAALTPHGMGVGLS